MLTKSETSFGNSGVGDSTKFRGMRKEENREEKLVYFITR